LKKKNSKKNSPEEPGENVWGPCENVSPGPAVALDKPGVIVYPDYERRSLRSCFKTEGKWRSRSKFRKCRNV